MWVLVLVLLLPDAGLPDAGLPDAAAVAVDATPDAALPMLTPEAAARLAAIEAREGAHVEWLRAVRTPRPGPVPKRVERTHRRRAHRIGRQEARRRALVYERRARARAEARALLFEAAAQVEQAHHEVKALIPEQEQEQEP